MGDRCYMQITCRKQDAERFKKLGFDFEYEGEEEKDSPTVTMIDQEANYAHCGSLPSDIPWIGRSEAGGTYGPDDYACDGKTLVEVESGFEGGYVIELDDDGNPRKGSLDNIRKFNTVRKAAEEILGLAPVND